MPDVNLCIDDDAARGLRLRALGYLRCHGETGTGGGSGLENFAA
jgi:hypothetical protein